MDTNLQVSIRFDGVMGELINEFDWSATPLGALRDWPEVLKTAVSIILLSSLPMAILWGEDGILLYNVGFSALARGRHPAGLGSEAARVWPELAVHSKKVLAAGLHDGPVALRKELLVLECNGYREDVWVDVDYSPITDGGRPAGVLALVREITEHVLSKWRRQEAENQLALAIDATKLGTWNHDLRTGELNCSRHCKAAFGIAADAPTSIRDFYSGLHPADRKATLAALDRSLDPRLREIYDGEYRTIGAHDKQVRWVASRGRATFDEQGNAIRTTGTVMEITARKNAELRQANLVILGDQLRALETTHEIATVSAELLGRAVHARRTGYATIQNEQMVVECDWTDRHAVSLAGPRPLAAMGPHCVATLRRGQVLVINDVATDPNMTPQSRAHFREINVASLLKAPLITNGELAAVLYVHHSEPRSWTEEEVSLLKDIADRTWEASGRAAAAAALRTLNETLEQEIAYRTAQRDRMWKLSSDVMLVARFDATIESVNPAWRTVFGWREADVIGRNFIDLTHPEDRPSTREEVRRLAQGQPTTRFESRYRRRDGSYVWLSWRAVPDAASIHAVGRDITAEREQAEALAAAEEALRQAQKMEAVGQLTGGIAHDFNNLLQGIVGALDLIDKRIAQGRTDELERFVSAARVSANRAVALTHRLLAFSRRQPLDPKPVQANPLVTSIEDLLRRTMGEGIEIALTLAPDLWLTLCDPNQLESALLNLAINARDAMPDGGRLVLETGNTRLDAAYAARTPEVRPGDYICLSVTDTGTGMPQSVIDQAFEPFYTTKPIGQGTGLGLSMIYGFARQSGGHAKIYSEPGRGTTVKLYLPRHAGAMAADETASIAGPEPRATVGETVLVVEDETVVRGLVVEVLNELGYHALEAGNGPGGLEILQSRQRVDLLITDIGLPGLNGRQVADAARLLRPELKILFMTGYAANAAMSSGFLEPGMAMITKPFPIEQLATRIRTIMES